MATYSEIRTIEIRPSCGGGSVYLRWLTNLGAWDDWEFTGEKVNENEVQEGPVFLAANGRQKKTLGRPAADTLLLRAGGLTKDEAEGLKTLYNSPQVYIQQLDASLSPVRLVQNSFTVRDEANQRYTCEVKIETRLLNSQVN